ncbi:DUF6919 domain-containing protein [Actinoplanes sp. G11-F43]|uniref:DUF6919 domain-containing protein n=1 Tax=Actinoplanes sp. G11-F43 TaxID=3424130 RepID=UPI003D35258C
MEPLTAITEKGKRMRDLLRRLAAGLDAMLQREPMPEADRVWWLSATTIPELARVGALWLEGWIGSQPAYAPGYGPDTETLPFVPLLADVNRAGFYTTGSQAPDSGVPGLQVTTSLDGFADDAVTARLLSLLRGSGLAWSAWHQSSRRFESENRRRRAWRGHPAREITDFWGSCRAEAVDALRAGWQITITDPQPGRGRLLWPVLAAFAAEAPAADDRLLAHHRGFGPAMPTERAHAVYDVLTTLAGAPDAERTRFVAAHTARFLHRGQVPGGGHGDVLELCRHRHGDRLYVTTTIRALSDPAVLEQVTRINTRLDDLLGPGDNRWAPPTEHFHREENP